MYYTYVSLVVSSRAQSERQKVWQLLFAVLTLEVASSLTLACKRAIGARPNLTREFLLTHRERAFFARLPAEVGEHRESLTSLGQVFER